MKLSWLYDTYFASIGEGSFPPSAILMGSVAWEEFRIPFKRAGGKMTFGGYQFNDTFVFLDKQTPPRYLRILFQNGDSAGFEIPND